VVATAPNAARHLLPRGGDLFHIVPLAESTVSRADLCNRIESLVLPCRLFYYPYYQRNRDQAALLNWCPKGGQRTRIKEVDLARIYFLKLSCIIIIADGCTEAWQQDKALARQYPDDIWNMGTFVLCSIRVCMWNGRLVKIGLDDLFPVQLNDDLVIICGNAGMIPLAKAVHSTEPFYGACCWLLGVGVALVLAAPEVAMAIYLVFVSR